LRRSPDFDELKNEQLLTRIDEIQAALEDQGRFGIVKLRGAVQSFVAVDLPASRWFWHPGNDMSIVVSERKIYSSQEAKIDSIADLIAWRCSSLFREAKFIFNESKIRLKTDLSLDSLRDGSPVDLQRTTYLDSLATHETYPLRTYWPKNETPDAQARRRRECEAIELFIDGDFEQKAGVREFRKPTGMVPLDNSRLSNHFGVNILVFNRKMGFILQRQGIHSAIDPEQLVTTGSGSSDWFRKVLGVTVPISNVKAGGSFRKLIVSEALRELAEESRLRLRDVDRQNVEIVGYARRFDRGLKPDFYFFLKIADDYPDGEAEILRRAHRGKEILFVDDFVTDLFLFAVVWPEEIANAYQSPVMADRQLAKQQMQNLVEVWFAEEDFRTLKEMLHDECRGILSDETLLQLRTYRHGEHKPVEYWTTLLKLMTVFPAASPALRVTASCVLLRIQEDPEFAKNFEPDLAPVPSFSDQYDPAPVTPPSD